MQLGEGHPLEQGAERGEPPEKSYFAGIGCSSVKMVADRHRRTAYILTSTGYEIKMSTLMTLNDLGLKIEVFVIFGVFCCKKSEL